MFNRISATIGVWFGTGAMFGFLALLILYPNDINRICEGYEDLSILLEAIKFEKKPSCVKMDF